MAKKKEPVKTGKKEVEKPVKAKREPKDRDHFDIWVMKYGQTPQKAMRSVPTKKEPVKTGKEVEKPG